ncbi:MAG: hypothetical protein ABI353_16550 [Isosphaeraceae bacterium]
MFIGIGALVFGLSVRAEVPPVDPEAAERGRLALTTNSFLPPAWPLDAYTKAGAYWDPKGPDPVQDPDGYAAAFGQRYGLNPAPFPNDGLPMGLRRATSQNGAKVGIQLDCLVCHGGSIGGQGYVGLGNSQIDLHALLLDLTRASGRIPLPNLFIPNDARGMNDAGQIAVSLLSLRNADLSFRRFPLLTGARLPNMDTPAWWIMSKKSTKYYDGRTDARSARSNMQFLLGDLTLAQLKDLEPAYTDIDAFIKTIKAPKYPFPIDQERADRGLSVFKETCARCHGTYGPDGAYPNKVVPLDVVGTDPARAQGLKPRFIAHYNTTWLAEGYPADEELIGYQAPPLDGVWATAPYLHNGSVPTLYHMLKSKERPARYLRPRTTDFEHYDQENVGWRFETFTERPDRKTSPYEAGFYFDTKRWGLDNGGHTFGDKLSDGERRDVIEYLKTL